MNSMLPGMSEIVPLLSLYRNGFGMKRSTKVDMQLKQETDIYAHSYAHIYIDIY